MEVETNVDILLLEGWDLLFGWHAYLIYNKKVDRIFKSHILRISLLRVWKKYYRSDSRIPLWDIPWHAIEGIRRGVKMDIISYTQLLKWDGKNGQLKSMDELVQENIIYSWFLLSPLRKTRHEKQS